MLKGLFRKKKRRSSKSKNYQVRKSNHSKKMTNRKKKYVRGEEFYPNLSKYYIYSSLIIFFGFVSLSLTIFLFTKQIKPLLKNERLKFLCTYQIGDKKNKSYNDAKIKLDKLVGDSDKFCKNFIFPKEKRKRGSRVFPFLKNIIFRFI